MHPLLSPEEINALLNESIELLGESLSPFIVKMKDQDIILQEPFDLKKGSIIEVGESLNKSHEIWYKGKLSAYGMFVMIDNKLAIQITCLIGCDDRDAVE